MSESKIDFFFTCYLKVSGCVRVQPGSGRFGGFWCELTVLGWAERSLCGAQRAMTVCTLRMLHVGGGVCASLAVIFPPAVEQEQFSDVSSVM